MRLMNKLLDLALYIATIPLLCVGLFALIDAMMASSSAKIDKKLIEGAAIDDGSSSLFEKLDAESEYVMA